MWVCFRNAIGEEECEKKMKILVGFGGKCGGEVSYGLDTCMDNTFPRYTAEILTLL